MPMWTNLRCTNKAIYHPTKNKTETINSPAIAPEAKDESIHQSKSEQMLNYSAQILARSRLPKYF
jgi:hypothetical protein